MASSTPPDIDLDTVVPESEIAVETPLASVGSGLAPEQFAIPRPDLSGFRFSLPRNPQTPREYYLIDPEGFRRYIPNPQTYNNLFVSWDGVRESEGVIYIALGEQLSTGSILATPDPPPGPVYFVSNGMKRWISSATLMDKYHFDWGKVRRVPPLLLDAIPTGPDWSR